MSGTGYGKGGWGESKWGTGVDEGPSPAIVNPVPAPDSVSQPSNIVIRFDFLDCADIPLGIDITTVLIYVDGGIAYTGATDTFSAPYNGVYSSITPVPGGFSFEIDKNVEFLDGAIVSVRVVGDDLSANSIDETYTFQIFDLPTSATWSCMDLIGSDMAQALSFPSAIISRGAPWFSINGGNDDMEIFSDDGVLSSYRLPRPISQVATFEFNFKPSVLPPDLTSLNTQRFFVGMFDRQDNGAGLLFSRAGLAVVSDFGSSALVIPGSQDLVDDGEDYYTVRLVIDGLSNLMHVYITPEADLGIAGHQLRFTTAAPETPAGQLDEIKIEIIGNGSNIVTGKFDKLRVNCNTALIPNQRPIADPGVDQTARLKTTVLFDGSNSYDPEGQPLTHLWRLLEAPIGSKFRTENSGGSTVDEGDADGFTTVFSSTGQNAFSTSNAPLLQPGDTLYVEGINYYVSTERWLYDSATQKYVRDTGGAWNDDEIVIEIERLPDNLSQVEFFLFHGATFFSDMSVEKPYATPDIQGLYTVLLTVNDGELDSLPVEALLNVASTITVLGCVPDVGWIWNNLSDFWRLVEDKDKVETVWQGFAQTAANQLMTAWQIDYNKSLLDIQRCFQRRWLSYSTLLDDDKDTAVIRVLRGPIYSTDLAAGANITGKTLQVVLDGGQVETVTFTGGDPVSLDDIVTQINVQLGFSGLQEKLAKKVVNGAEEYLVLEYTSLVRVRPAGTANADLGFSTTEYMQNDLRGSSGRLVSAVQRDAFDTIDPPVLDLFDEGVVQSDLLVVSEKGYGIQKVALDSLTKTQNRGLTLLSKIPAPTSTGAADTLSSVAITTQTIVDASSLFDASMLNRYITISGAKNSGNNGTFLITGFVDETQIEYTNPAGVLESSVGVTWFVLDETPWIIPSIVTSEVNDFTASLVQAGDLARFEVENVTTGLVTEVMCEVVGIAGNKLGFDPQPLLAFWDGNTVGFDTFFIGVKRTQCIPINDLVVEVPRLQDTLDCPEDFLTQNKEYIIDTVDDQNAICFVNDTFSLADPPADEYWAEVTFLDNRSQIEANFGRLVDFTVENLDTRTDDLDYLAAVQGLWWAYFGGPAVKNVKVGVQILLGLPFAEVDGVIEEINDSFSTTEGRVIIRDKKNTDIVRSYFYPTAAGLGVNDAGVTLAVGDVVAQFDPLSGGIEVLDYKNAPNWPVAYISQNFFSEVEKFFRFLVRADVDTFNVLNIAFAIDFVKKIKPHYTHPLFTLLKNVQSAEVDVFDIVTINVIKRIYDTPCPDTNYAYRYDDTDGAGLLVHAYDVPPYFAWDQTSLCPAEDIWVVLQATLGAGAWIYDSIWAYDDGDTDNDSVSNDKIPLSGPDSSLPAPYGPLVGVVSYDDTKVAGIYTRSIELK